MILSRIMVIRLPLISKQSRNCPETCCAIIYVDLSEALCPVQWVFLFSCFSPVYFILCFMRFSLLLWVGSFPVFFMNDFFLSPLLSLVYEAFFYTILLSLLWVASRLFSSYLMCGCFLTLFLDYPWCLSCLFYEWLFSTVFSFSCLLYEWLLSLSSRILFKIGFSYSSFVFFFRVISFPSLEWVAFFIPSSCPRTISFILALLLVTFYVRYLSFSSSVPFMNGLVFSCPLYMCICPSFLTPYPYSCQRWSVVGFRNYRLICGNRWSY